MAVETAEGTLRSLVVALVVEFGVQNHAVTRTVDELAWRPDTTDNDGSIISKPVHPHWDAVAMEVESWTGG